MSFVVSARKYRPIEFRDVVGQKTITTTLKNAIRNDKLAQSFLFCGPRGVGKTTCARILAKVINCQNLTDQTEACNTCEACVSFNNSASFNVFELDAASNNSVDDIRSLIEQVRFAPQVGNYKIYIIDEVHMLSQAAFNAFLKTLEEPPKYAIFILATTEKHKILPTILSRCQIFDFQRIKVSDIVEHLQFICQDQQITADENALHVIAQKADGGLRDALSIFDRIASYSGGTLQYHNVVEALNMLDYDYFFKVTDALLAQDTATALVLYDDIVQRGFEGDNFLAGLSEHFRNLFVCKDAATVQLLDVTQNLRDRYSQQARLASSSFLLTALNIATQAELAYKSSKQKHLPIELALLKMCCINNVLDWSSLPATQTQHSPAAEKKNDAPKLNNPPPPPPSYKNTPPPPSVAQEANLLQRYKKDNNTPLLPTPPLDETPPPSSQKMAAPATTTASHLPPQSATKLSTTLLAQYWEEFATTIGENNVKAVFSIVKPQLQSSKNDILIELSDLQNRMINHEITRFLGYLRREKQVEPCEIERQIVQNQTASETVFRPAAYLPDEQLREMVQLNPHLGSLVTKMSLEIIG